MLNEPSTAAPLTTGQLPLDRVAAVAAKAVALCRSLGGDPAEVAILATELAAAEKALGQDLEAGVASHRQASRVHAKRRAFERLGLALHESDLSRIEKRCRTAAGGPSVRKAKASLVRSDSNGRQVFSTIWNGRRIFPVWCPTLGCLVSFVPRGWAEASHKPGCGKGVTYG